MHYDVIVAGGSFAGLSAALTVARTRRRVLVIDAGRPRNRFADASHGFLGFDGQQPGRILETARAQLAEYREVRIVEAEATGAAREGAGFRVDFAGGPAFSDHLVLATGIVDVLPEVPGLAERWGKSVAHCPFCHGYEIDGPLAVLATGPVSLHQVRMIALWGQTTFFTDGRVTLDDAERAELARRGIAIEETPVAALEGAGTTLDGLRLADGRKVAAAGLFVAPGIRMGSPLAGQLGCAFEDVPTGRIVKAGADRSTSVAGVFAVGDMARGAHSVTFAVADGAMAGAAITHGRLMAA